LSGREQHVTLDVYDEDMVHEDLLGSAAVPLKLLIAQVGPARAPAAPLTLTGRSPCVCSAQTKEVWIPLQLRTVNGSEPAGRLLLKPMFRAGTKPLAPPPAPAVPPQPSRFYQKHAQLLQQRQQEDASAVRIQALYRGHSVRRADASAASAPAKPARSSASAKRSAETATAATGVDDAQLNAAATAIQAAYRGHAVRSAVERESRPPVAQRRVQERNPTAAAAGAKPGSALQASGSTQLLQGRYASEAEAATKIQATYRGHRVRAARPAQAKASTQAPASVQPRASLERPPQQQLQQQQQQQRPVRPGSAARSRPSSAAAARPASGSVSAAPAVPARRDDSDDFEVLENEDGVML
jgi:hypothetical protein